jgi:outer membrane protein OmpA-like peptidoglycan-associated protein
MSRTICLLILVTLLAACAAPTPQPPAAEAPASMAVQEDLAAEMAQLPGISVVAEGPLRGAFPGATLFAAGAVLPLPGGMEMLEPLAEFLRRHPDTRWTMQVRAATEFSTDYDRSLAQTRAELLLRYFTRKGLDMQRFEFTAEAGEGATLGLRLR